jgi:hypothetical protein
VENRGTLACRRGRTRSAKSRQGCSFAALGQAGATDSNGRRVVSGFAGQKDVAAAIVDGASGKTLGMVASSKLRRAKVFDFGEA